MRTVKVPPEVQRFEEAYRGVPPWDIGEAQPAFVELESRESFGPRVLDVGCGTGDLALYLGSRGHQVIGVDIVEAAIAKAKKKGGGRTPRVTFLHGNALELHEIITDPVDTIVDSGVFHTFPPALRAEYRESLEHVLRPGGTYYMLVWSDREVRPGGPLRISERDIRETFAAPWRIDWVEHARFAAHAIAGGAEALMSKLTYEGEVR